LSWGWWSIGEDSLEIVGSSGFFGVEFRGHFTVGGFEGSAASFTDFANAEPVPRHPFTAVRAHCLGY
jgi:hypothetical protein